MMLHRVGEAENIQHTCLKISVPHHLNPFIQPGYINTKKTTRTPNAIPESRAAERVIVYFPHQAGARRRKR